jgi:hypothetical protein
MKAPWFQMPGRGFRFFSRSKIDSDLICQGFFRQDELDVHSSSQAGRFVQAADLRIKEDSEKGEQREKGSS